MSTKKLTVKECVVEYRQVCDKINELEKYKNSLHQKLTEYLQNQGQGQQSLTLDEYTIKLVEQTRETVGQKQLPTELWNKYKQVSKFTRLIVKKNQRSSQNR